MGSLNYDGLVIGIDDRVLTHLQIVIVNKLRKGESFLMSWKDAPDVGDGRSAIWIHPHISIHFKFEGSKIPSINGEWLASLARSADSSRGLIVAAEEGALAGVVHPQPNHAPLQVAPAADSQSVASSAL